MFDLTFRYLSPQGLCLRKLKKPSPRGEGGLSDKRNSDEVLYNPSTASGPPFPKHKTAFLPYYSLFTKKASGTT